MTTSRAMVTSGRLLLPAAVLVNTLLLWNFHDQHWYVVDEGSYAHIAERLLAGDVLHRDVQDIHPGYINFLNAAAFAVFGVDLVSLRYPLVVAALAQALLVWRLLARRDALIATVASIATTALGVVQFLNPTAHWYCLFLTVLLVGWLSGMPPTHRARTIGAGVLLGTIALFRQLTGVWVAIAVLLVLLREQSTGARGRDAIVGRALVLAALLVLLAYLLFAGGPEATGILLIAAWPVAILCLMLRDVGTTNRASLGILSQLTLGAAVAALPIVLYHIAHGSFAAWIDDTVFAPLELTALPFFGRGSFALLPAAGMLQVVRPYDLATFANGLYWVTLPLLPAVNGILVIRWMRRGLAEVPILPVAAAFYPLVTLHLAGPIYLYYTIGLTVAGVLWFAAAGLHRRHIPYIAAAAAALVVVAVGFHAGQSSLRTPIEIARGYRTVTTDTLTCPPSGRSSLRVERNDCDSYHQLSRAIEAETPPGGHIFALPSDAELYFLTGRSNPFRFFNSALGVRTAQDLEAVLKVLTDRPPWVVAYRPDDKYNTDASRRIMEYVHTRYDRFGTIGGVELYRPRTIGTQEAE